MGCDWGAAAATVATMLASGRCRMVSGDGRCRKWRWGGMRREVGHLLGEGCNLLSESSKHLLCGLLVCIVGQL